MTAEPHSLADLLPATLDDGELERRLADVRAAAIMKVGRHLSRLRTLLERLGLLASAIYVSSPEQRAAAEATRDMFQRGLTDAGYGEITTEIADAGPFYYAEPYHQQYLAKNPNGYCGLGGTGVSCPVGVALS